MFLTCLRSLAVEASDCSALRNASCLAYLNCDILAPLRKISMPRRMFQAMNSRNCLFALK